MLLLNRSLPYNYTDNFSSNNPIWIGSTWANVGGKAVNTPTLGNELLTDGGLENWDSATVLHTPWVMTLAGTTTLNRDGADKYDESYSLRIDTDASASLSFASQPVLLSLNNWALVSAYVKVLNAGKQGVVDFGSALGAITGNSTSWTQYKSAVMQTIASPNIVLRRAGGASSTSMWFDKLTARYISFPSLYRSIKFSTPYGTIKSNWTIVAGTPAGVVMNMDDPYNPQNCVYANHNGTNAILRQRIAGVDTVLVNAAATYGAGKNVMIKHPSAGLYQLWYGAAGAEVQVGTDQNIVGLNGTYHGLFSTDSQNTCFLFAFTGG
jgi:hypothetical protein